MNKLYIYILFLLGCMIYVSCSFDSKYEIRKLYIESQNMPQAIEACFMEAYKDKNDTVYNYHIAGEKKDKIYIIYKYYDFSTLPTTNLLNGTRKIKVLYLNEKDSVGNALYSVQSFRSDNSNWIREWNLGDTSFYSDTLLTNNEICNRLSSCLNISLWKFLP